MLEVLAREEFYMYAIIETGGKQYRVKEGDLLRVEKLPVEVGETVVLDKVLALKDEKELRVGRPYLPEVKVIGKVEAQGKGEKIIVFKYKPKKNYRRKKGHRQPFTALRIERIELG